VLLGLAHVRGRVASAREMDENFEGMQEWWNTEHVPSF
jgi:hypothetical protein